jgi:transposase-like protein/transposase
MTIPVSLVLTGSDRKVLEARVAASTTSRRDWQRAKIVLLAADGVSSSEIGRRVELNRNQVDVWRRRYGVEGIGSLVDRDRPGRPLVYGPFERMTLVKTITTRPPESGQMNAKRIKGRMSMPEVASRLRDVHGIPISYSQTWRICKSLAIKPWQVRSWMTSHDPAFDDKAVDVCDLYLHPADNWAVFSVDEKTGIQAKSRVNPTKPARPATLEHPKGEPVHQEFEYKRHGVTGLFAAFNCGDGSVYAEPTNSTCAVNFIEFLTALDAQVPAHLELHCIVDNYAAHGTPAVEAFLDNHQRVFLHRTPTHASWLNQVEIWFSILTRQLLDTAEFDSTTNAAGAILDYITEYNQRAKPFRWTYNAKNKHAA